ncbi:MAG: YggS family pyridoxal phosphate-dependent enzyme [Chloroflexi bacterium]|nr:YggS family pyridoxal phosphate-dependent enzyme [Chloroflexota bacterium]
MSIADNIKRVEDSIAAACGKVDRDPAEITLVAVSKQKSVEEMVAAAAAGINHFGENRVEEGIEKIESVNKLVAAPVRWHMVGHVQSRKVKRVLPLFDLVQSVDSLRLAQKLSRLAQAKNQTLDILLEINISGEASKYGLKGYNCCGDNVEKEKLWQEIGAILALDGLRVKGLMTMAPYGAAPQAVRRVFADLFSLREELTGVFAISLPELSMGMTDDYQIAIEEGATIVRIGRAIFGERKG